VRRLSFRTRLALIITVVFVAGGAGLLAVQYLVVQQLFASAIHVTSLSCELGGSETVTIPDQGTTGCQLSGTGGEIPGIEGAVIQQTTYLSEEVSGGLLIGSIVMLVVFAAVAAGIAFWLARRSLDRIGEVTAATRAITERDLGRRLDLPGPNDEIKELGDTIDGMLDRLQLAFAAQDRFVANASHELRTPLTTTRAALEIPLTRRSRAAGTGAAQPARQRRAPQPRTRESLGPRGARGDRGGEHRP
jgi:signal transduction histidine kinase